LCCVAVALWEKANGVMEMRGDGVTADLDREEVAFVPVFFRR
jgi:hypothetical protein